MTTFAMLGAQWVLWLLVGISLVAVAVIVERAVVLLGARQDVNELRRHLLGVLRKGDLRAARHLLQESPCIEARIAEAALETDALEGAHERMAAASERVRQDLERRLAFLGTVGHNAPFVGLLGTVLGIIRALHELDPSGGSFPPALMSEIGEALVATAMGLLVALPAVAIFDLFRHVIHARMGHADALAREAVGYVKALRPHLEGLGE